MILYQRHVFFCVKFGVSFWAKKAREVLLYFLNVKKFAVELYRSLVETYGEAALSETTCMKKIIMKSIIKIKIIIVKSWK